MLNQTRRYLKQLLSPTNPLLKLTLALYTTSTINHVTHHQQQPSQPGLGPPPIRVGFTPSAGRGVFATRNIPLADLIHTADPVISHPSLSKLASVCYLCLRRIDSHLHAAPFCSQHCSQQAKTCEARLGSGPFGTSVRLSPFKTKVFYELENKLDWSAYHKYCRTLGLKYPLLVKRLACMVVTGAASADCIDILQPAHVLPEIEVEYSMLRRAFEDINLPKDNLKFLTEQWYADVLARVRINAFRIEMVVGSYEDLLTMATASVEAEAGVGNAVYILPSFYNHDCDPNVHIIWTDSVHAKLKALRDIAEVAFKVNYIKKKGVGLLLMQQGHGLGPRAYYACWLGHGLIAY